MASAPGFIRLVRALLLYAAWLPFCSIAQQPVAGVSVSQTQIMNARYIVLEGDRHLVEYGPSRWFLSSNSGNLLSPSTNTYTEAKRTETELFLMPGGDRPGSVPLVVDFAARKTFMEFEKINAWAAPVAIYPTSGYSVGRVDFVWHGLHVTLDVNGPSNKGWVLTSYKHDGKVSHRSTLPESAITRSIDNIKLHMGTDLLTVNPVVGTCTMTHMTCTVRAIAPISGNEVGHLKYGKLTKDNAWVGLQSLTQVSATKWREEFAFANRSVEWTEMARTPNYIDLRRAGSSDRIARFYMNIGSQVGNTDGQGSEFRVAHVQRQWPGQIGTPFQPVQPGMSPGFQIQNKTDYPVLVTLEQVGCLYYGIVQPGQVFQRDTGAVWFTIKASMAPDLKEPTVESCIRKPAMYAATIVVAGAAAAGTGGTATALVVPAMLATAAGQGAAIATEQYVRSQGGSATDGKGARMGVATLMSGATAVGLAFYSGGSLPVAAALWPTVQAMLPTAALGTAAVGAAELHTRLTQQSDIDSIRGQLTQEASVTGAYAGYPWPWKKADRVMPRYDITGGPRIKTLADGSTILLTQERPLSIAKVN